MHAHGKSHTRIVAAVPKYEEHAWEYVIISWRHNLEVTYLFFMFSIKEMSHVSWTLKILSFSKLIKQDGNVSALYS